MFYPLVPQMGEETMKRKIMLSVLALVLLCSAAGCDAGLKIVGMDINTYPDRIVYIAGVDDSLDLTGGTVKYYLKQKTESIYKMENNIYLNITDNINFNEPGVYVVTLTRAEYSCSFPIQVVDKDYMDRYSNE